jgi:hypothetical protein
MSYFSNKNGIGGFSKMNDTGLNGLVNKITNSTSEFYEFEPAVVLDIILDENHPLIQTKKMDVSSFPDNYKDLIPSVDSIDYTWIGRALVRQCFSQQGVEKTKLNWAMPLDVSGVVEYPLINEPVVVVKYFGKLYYTKRLNLRGMINNSADYRLEKVFGINSGLGVFGPLSLLTNKENKNPDYIGSLGNYFLTNNKIRRLKKYEGDTSIESRFGQSIRFASYDSLRKNDISKYIDYSADKNLNKGNVGGGNPMILIRNRQRKLALDQSITVHPLLPPIPPIKDVEKNVGGLIEEDINHDGSSIHITSGLTETNFKTTVYKSMFGQKSEEQPKFNGITSFKFPNPINGEQIVINSDRLIFSSRFAETFHFSKKRYAIVTDSEYTIDAQDQIVITTNNKTVINSPSIYLGQYDEVNEPAILGQTNVNWLYDLCTQLENLCGNISNLCTSLSNHTHPNGGSPSDSSNDVSLAANTTQIQTNIKGLQNILNTLLSRRVFVTGGGLAQGADGVLSTNYDGNANVGGTAPNFAGANRR